MTTADVFTPEDMEAIRIKEKRRELIEEVKSWGRSYRSDGEPGLPDNRYTDEMIDHLELLTDEQIDAIEDIHDYDYRRGA
jgi:hypothetical protein